MLARQVLTSIPIYHHMCSLLMCGSSQAMLDLLVQAMVWDTKRNSMLLPASKLSRMIHSYRDIGDKGRCGFRVPHKRLW